VTPLTFRAIPKSRRSHCGSTAPEFQAPQFWSIAREALATPLDEAAALA
jgi:hypothetical protein